MINFIPDYDAEANTREMTDSLKTVQTGEVTYAVRDTVLDGKEIKKGDIMGIGDHSILSVSKSVDQAVKEMVEEMVTSDSELITLYYGEDIEEDSARDLMENLKSRFPEIDVEIQYGGQPVYYYILSVE